MIERFCHGVRCGLLAAAFGFLVLPAAGLLAPAAISAAADSDSSSGSSSDSSDSSSDDGPFGGSDDSGPFVGPDDDDGDDRPRRAIAPAPAPVTPPPRQAPDEIVIAALDAASLGRLEALGYQLLAGGASPLPRALLRIPPARSVDDALAEARAVVPLAEAAPNSYYRHQAVPSVCEAEICRAWAEVGWPPANPVGACTFAPHIGIVDTGVNIEHEMLRSADVTVETIGTTGAAPSEMRHGTAIVAMFVGDPAGRVPGLAPASRILVADAFGTDDGEERADLFALLAAIDRLRVAAVDVISLSLAGDDNPLLEAVVGEAMMAGIPVVAAVGNAGAAAPALYPAAYPGVVAVTAVDLDGTVYRRAVQGPHVQFSAPGVNVATAASISGVRPQTGTSFAVPFVTTAVAALQTIGVAEDLLATLAASAIDLGEAGHDPVFGWGLIQIPDPCGTGA